MNKSTRKLSLTAVSVIAVICMLLSQFLILPQNETFAAGTDLYVGYSGQNNNFSTVQEAVEKAASLNPSSESSRVTIHIAPGTYREQVVVQSPYITLKNDTPSKEVKITWYYGIGYKYYSCNSKGYYDKTAAASKSVKNTASYRWGATVQLWPKATNFKAENIVFENSFNRYMTQEEIADGVECTNETLTVQRYSGVDVQSKAYTERAAAFSADAAYCEFLNCKFLSSQDTLYTGVGPQYYKNCHIEGQTDYIFGDSSVVFDTCDLVWKGYSSGTTGGYITAARDDDNDDTGYLFSNCTIKKGELPVSTGYLGRPWRDTAKVMFINTILESGDLINAQGWTSMSGVQPESVEGFKEYGTKLSNGAAADLSQRKGHILSANDAAGIKLTNYMKNWTPSYLNASGSTTDPSVPAADGAIKLCGGWYEEAFVEWDSSKIGSNVEVSYVQTGSSNTQYNKVDSQLIRGTRVDIPGLKGNTSYDITVKGSSGSAKCTVKTMAFDRSGYAHWNYSSGVGAYNNDGTLKTGVEVIYVTNSNKDTITYGGKTGLYNIFYSAKPKNVCFRLIGTIDVPAGARANDGSSNDGSSMLYLQYGENVTIEGIGYDTNLNKWGFEMKRSTSCEVRNLWLGKYPDDGISMTGSSDSKSTHMWIHNNTIEKGYNQFAGNGTVDDDKADGDGSADIKWSEYVTISYNEFKDCHKTSLVGGGPTQFQDWITYHHNWFNNTESRNPRARNAHIHSYNNYFTTNAQYGIGASYNSKIFSEANYFESSTKPLAAEAMGSDAYSGTIKSYNDKFVNCKMGSGLAYKIVSSRSEQASISNQKSGGDAYDNFDLDSSKIYGSYSVQSADAAKSEVMAYAGRMQNKGYNSGTVSGTDNPVTGAEFAEGLTVMLKNVNSGLYMEVANGSAENGANVQQWGANGEGSNGAAEWNTWVLRSAGDGYYCVYSALAGGNAFVLDVAGKKTDNNTNIDIYQPNGGDNQQFKFYKNSDGSYKLLTKVTGDKSAVEVVGASKESGANVSQYQVNGVNCQDWEIIPVTLPISGKLIKNLVVDDTENGADWSVAMNAQVGDKMFGDRDFAITSLPASLTGAERVVTACDSKNVDAELAHFTANGNATVYVALDQRVATAPTWLGSYAKTGETLVVTDAGGEKLFDLYAMDVKAGDVVTLGTNGQSAGVMSYGAFVKEKAVIVTTTTIPVTTVITTVVTTTVTVAPVTTAVPVTEPVTTTASPVENVVWGDANEDGKVSMADATAVLQAIGNNEKYGLTEQGVRNADVHDHGDGLTGNDALVIQMVEAGIYTLDQLPIIGKLL